MLDEVVVLRLVAFACGHADDPAAPPALRAVAADVRALDQRGVREGDDDALVGDEVLDRHLALVGDDLRAALVAVLVADGPQLFLDDGEHALLLGQDVDEVGDRGEQLAVLPGDLVALQAGQLVEAQLEDGGDLLGADDVAVVAQPRRGMDLDAEALGLRAGEVVGGDLHARFLAIGGTADDLDHLVEVGQGDEVSLQHLGAALSLAQLEAGAAQHDLAAVLDEAVDQLLEIERLRAARIDGELADGEGGLQRGHLIELVDRDLRDGVALELDDHARVVVGLVAHVADFREFLGVDQFGDAGDQVRAVHIVGDFRDDDDFPAALVGFGVQRGADAHAATAGLEVILDSLHPDDVRAGGEIGSLDVLLHQLRDGDVGLVDLRADRIDHLAEIVRDQVRGHAHGDAGAAVDEQIGEGRGEDDGLFLRVVVVGDEIDGVLLQVVHQDRAEVRQPRLGVTHGRRRIVLDRAEVPFAVDEALAHRPRLRHVAERGVNHGLAVRVKVARGVAANLGAFTMLAAGIEAQPLHGEKDAALRGLQPVARVRERARDDDRHRVVEKRIADFLRDVDALDAFAGGKKVVRHDEEGSARQLKPGRRREKTRLENEARGDKGKVRRRAGNAC